MNRAWICGLLALAGLQLSGCVATQKDVLDLESQTDGLKSQITDLKKTVGDLQANQADLSIQMKQLQEDLGTFTEAVRENQDAMSKLSSKLDDMSAAIASKVASIGSSLTNAQAKGLDEQRAALQKTQDEIKKQEAAAANSPTELFNTADVRLALRNYPLAATGFEQYVQKFPDGALIDAATFKLGQAYYGDKKWEPAGRQFALYMEKYPKSQLIPSARLLYALCLLNMNRSLDEARQYLESVVGDYPKSPEAKQAAQYLKKMSKGRKKEKVAS